MRGSGALLDRFGRVGHGRRDRTGVGITMRARIG